jgi:hypothetical protein
MNLSDSTASRSHSVADFRQYGRGYVGFTKASYLLNICLRVYLKQRLTEIFFTCNDDCSVARSHFSRTTYSMDISYQTMYI